MQLDISTTNANISSVSRATIERHARFALTRFSQLIRDVAVTCSDESGPKGAPTKKCQIVVRLRKGGSVVVDATDRRLGAAASTAADRASRSVARQLERNRHNKKFQRRRVDKNSKNLAQPGAEELSAEDGDSSVIGRAD